MEGRVISKSFLNGYVDVTISGRYPDLLIRHLHKQGVSFYNLEKLDASTVTVRMKYSDAFKLRSIRKDFRCKVKFHKRGGVPHYYQKRSKFFPILLSIVLVIGFIFVLSNMIWKVEINGGSPEVRYEVEELIETLGMNRGSFIQSMESISSIEREIMNKIEEVSYVGIKRTGTSFHIMIEENNNNNIKEQNKPSNLVATNSGTIQKIYVSNGRPLVRINDVVQKGDVLVTGRLDDENEVYTYSEGEVVAEVWYNITGTINLANEKKDLIDDVKTNYGLGVGNRSWFMNKSNEQRLLFEESKPIYFLVWKTPLSIDKKYYYPEDTSVETFEDEQIIDEVIEEQLKRKLGQSVEVLYQKILHQEKDSDKVKLEMFVKVLEDITEEQIINQGD
ncbi:sporulation protein YqfD [Piscibacillus sp. B03]|uniref:sporulation protein YqfD n=1 Tax=Piscibacillus sp. B03 TaxID=3457430 RepID=UPI003FCDDE81